MLLVCVFCIFKLRSVVLLKLLVVYEIISCLGLIKLFKFVFGNIVIIVRCWMWLYCCKNLLVYYFNI